MQLRGGLIQGLEFSDLRKKVTIADKGAKFGPKWQQTQPGVNLVGDHPIASDCRAAGQMVYLPLGLGEKIMNKEVPIAKCHIC